MIAAAENNGRREIFVIQALRAFAATAVLTGHLLGDIVHRIDPAAHGLMRLPWLSGVDVFFAISGFIMVYTSWSGFGRTESVRRFVVHRVIRVVPLYFLFTTAMVAVVLIAPGVLGETVRDPAQIIASYLFFPYRRATGEIQPVLPTGWTLNYEMYFYALFAAAMLLPRRAAIPLLTAFFVGSVLLHPVVRPFAACLDFWTNDFILEFLAGVLVGCLLKSGIRNRRSPGLGLAALALAFAIFFARPFVLPALHIEAPRLLGEGLPALLLVVACTLCWPRALDERVPRLFRRLGDSSYALYLLHPFVLRIADLLFAGALVRLHAGGFVLAAYAVAVVVATVASGHAVHVLVERPLTRRLIRWRSAAPSPRPTYAERTATSGAAGP